MTKESTLEILLLNRQQIQENSYYALEFLEEQNRALANETDEELQLVLQFNNSLAQFYFHSNYRESIRISVETLARYPNSTNYNAVGQHLSFTGVCYTFLNEFDKAEEYLNRALEMAEKVVNEKPMLKVSILQSLFENSHYRKDAPDVSVAFLKKALAVLIEHHEPMRMYGCLLQLGMHYYEQADYFQARSHFHRAAAGFEETMHLQNLAITYSGIGKTYYKQGKHNEAEEYLNKALTLCLKAATPDNTALCNYDLAKVYLAQNNWIKALQHAQNSKDIFEETANAVESANVDQLLIEIKSHLQVA